MSNEDWAWKPDIHNQEPVVEVGLRYAFIKKASGKTHEIDPTTGKSFCKFENGSKRRILFSAETPENRQLCLVCERKKMLDPNGDSLSKKDKKDFYASHEWATLRYKAFLEYGNECVVCHRSVNLTVDHIKPISRYPELKTELSNLQVMCRLCNRGKGGWDETDWKDGKIISERG